MSMCVVRHVMLCLDAAVVCVLYLLLPSSSPSSQHTPQHPCTRLEASDVICDGFYDVEGDFPEITDNPAEFPTIAALRHVRCFEADPREVRLCAGPQGNNRMPVPCHAVSAVLLPPVVSHLPMP